MAKNIKRTVDIDPIWTRFTKSGDGHFEALVRLSENYSPDYMKIMGPFTPGVMRAKVPSAALSRLEHDENVLGVEVREFIGA